LDLYYETLTSIAGDAIFGELWAKFIKLKHKCGEELDRFEQAIEKEILPDPKLGPVAKTIVQMWYLGQWSQLPPEWREKYGTNPSDFNQVISPASYVEGLVWRAAGAHPQGAKPPGFGTWSAPPVQIAAPEAGKAAMAAEED
jgi:hypothetical protein